MKTVVNLYDNIADAEETIHALVNAGFDRADISMVAANRWGDLSANDKAGNGVASAPQSGNDVAAGMATGGMVGGLSGILLGLGALAVPGVGPIIAAGPLVAGLTGAGIGAAVGGLVGALVNWGVPPNEAELYAESIRRGSVLVGLKTDESRVAKAASIMNRFHPVDMERRSEYWRTTGWTGYDASSAGWSAQQMEADQLNYDDYLDYSTFTPAFRDHYQTHYSSRGRDFDYYAPGYHYGYDLAMDQRWDEVDTWDELEAEARREWEELESNAGNAWDDFKDAVRRGWEDVRNALDMEEEYAEYEPFFRSHYEERFRGGQRDYDWYEPAYRFGYISGMDERYENYRTWDDRLESAIRRQWEAGEYAADSTWDDIKDAVRRGWDSVREALEWNGEEEQTMTGPYSNR